MASWRRRWFTYSCAATTTRLYFKRSKKWKSESALLQNHPGKSLGTDLMREAFDAKRGSLTDNSLSVAEREAWAHVFAGAIGLFKNPMSHRDVDLGPQRGSRIDFPGELSPSGGRFAKRRRAGPPAKTFQAEQLKGRPFSKRFTRRFVAPSGQA